MSKLIFLPFLLTFAFQLLANYVDRLLHDSLSLCFLCFLLCDWLLMVRMRPCAEGAQAPHWLPLCSCYCCHCSCAVSGQFHNASSVAFINILSLSSIQSYCLWLIALALFLLVFLFSVCFSHLISTPLFTSLSALFHYFMSFSIVFLPFSFSPVTLSYVLPPSVLTSPPTNLTVSFCLSPAFSLSHLTLNLKATLCCIFPHLSLAVSCNRLQCLSPLTSDYWCSQTLAETDHSLLICVQTFARLF